MGDLKKQLDEAHETIRVLRDCALQDGMAYLVLSQGVVDTLRFHDDCLCRHARKFLKAGLQLNAETELEEKAQALKTEYVDQLLTWARWEAATKSFTDDNIVGLNAGIVTRMMACPECGRDRGVACG